MSEISITAPEDIESKIKILAAGLHMDRSAVIRSIIDVGVRQKLIEYSSKSVYGEESLTGKSGRDCRDLDQGNAGYPERERHTATYLSKKHHERF